MLVVDIGRSQQAVLARVSGGAELPL